MEPAWIGLLGQLGAAIIGGTVAAVVAVRVTLTGIKKQFGLEDATVRVIRTMLQEQGPKGTWTMRSFRLLRHHIGGFTDDELRRMLLRAGAVRFGQKRRDDPSKSKGVEVWGLLERNRENLGRPILRGDVDPSRNVVDRDKVDVIDQELFGFEEIKLADKGDS